MSGSGLETRLHFRDEDLRRFCRKRRIRRLAFFGSVLREDFRPESDVDVLVEFEPGATPGLEFIRISEELSQLLGGRRVDLVTEKFLSPLLRESVLAEANVRYAA